MQFTDPQVEYKLAHADHIAPEHQEAISMAYRVRQQHLKRFERALLELIHLEADATRYRMQIAQLQRAIMTTSPDDSQMGEYMEKLGLNTQAAEQAEQAVDKARMALITQKATEYKLEVSL